MVIPITVLVLIAVPAAVTVWWRVQIPDRLAELTPTPQPVTVTLETHETTRQTPVSVQLTWGSPSSLAAPAWTGTVRAVFVTVGQALRSGDQVAVVDEVTRIAWHTDRPFFRILSSGATGDDVADLQRLLASMGFSLGEADGRFGPATASAVKAFAAELGVPSPSGDFDPGWIIWLPHEVFQIATIPLVVGTPAPPAGTPVAATAKPLTAIKVLSTDQQTLSLDPTLTLSVADQEFVAERSGALTSADLAILAGLVEEGTESIEGIVRLTYAEPAIQVPVSAVMTNPDAATCVWVSDQDSYTARAVTIVDGGPSVVDVSGVEAGREVLVNPAETLDDPSCP